MAERQTLELKFEVKSLNKSRKTIEYVKDAQALSGELEHALAEQFPDAKVTIKREEGIPIAPLIQHLIVSIDWHAVMSGVEKAAASFATTQVLTLLKEKFQDLSAKPMSSDDKTAAKKAAKTASKKTAAKKNKGKA